MSRYKKLFKRIFIFFISMFLLLMLAIAIALNFVFTPEKITPQIMEIINENVNASVTCQSIDPSFFSTFPYFSITLKNGSVITYKSLENEKIVHTKNDTLATFESCEITFNLIKILKKEGVDIKKATYKNSKIFAFIDENGKANWDILKALDEKEPEKEQDTTKSETSKYFKTFNVDKLEIINTNLHYEDVFTKALVDVPDFNLELKIKKNKEGLLLAVNTSGEQILFSKDDVIFLNKTNLSLTSNIQYNKKNKEIVLGKSILKANGIEFLADGNLKINKAKKEVFTDLELRLNVPSLKAFIDLVPENILEYKNDLITEGEVLLNGNIIGAYGKDVFPDINANLTIENGTFKFKNFPGEIDTFDANISSNIDFNTPTNTQVTVSKLHIKGTGIDITTNGEITNVIENANVDANILGNINFTKLKNAFPINKDIQASGIADVDLNTSFTKNTIVNKDYQSINASGSIHLDQVYLHHEKENFIFKSQDTDASFGRHYDSDLKNNLNGAVIFNGIEFKYKNKHSVTLDHLSLLLNTETLSEENKTLNAEISLKELNYAYGDSIKGIVKRSHANVLFKSTAYKKRPLTISKFTIDSAGIWGYKRFIGIKNGNYNLTFENTKTKFWQPKGDVEFNALYVYTPKFPVLIEMKHSTVSIENDNLMLNKAAFKFGNSDATLTGKVSHIMASIQKKKEYEAELNLEADFIDTNQIMALIEKQETATEIIAPKETIENGSETDVVAKKSTFIIPDSLSFKFNTNIKKVTYDNLDITDIHGKVTLKDQALNFTDLYCKTLAANVRGNLTYKAKTKEEADIDYKVNLEDIQLKNLVTLFPSLNTLFSMAKSFEGNVNFRMKGSAKLNKDMEVVVPSVESIAALQAKNLIIHDSPTFAEISKTLMFKNKERNYVDNFQAEMKIENSHLEIFPAELTIDRYRIAAGGIQNLDMSYKYHISILKSPVPFKAGVDISGNFDDYKIDITKANYKYYFSDKKRLQNKADSTIINTKAQIIKELDF